MTTVNGHPDRADVMCRPPVTVALAVLCVACTREPQQVEQDPPVDSTESGRLPGDSDSGSPDRCGSESSEALRASLSRGAWIGSVYYYQTSNPITLSFRGDGTYDFAYSRSEDACLYAPTSAELSGEWRVLSPSLLLFTHTNDLAPDCGDGIDYQSMQSVHVSDDCVLTGWTDGLIWGQVTGSATWELRLEQP